MSSLRSTFFLSLFLASCASRTELISGEKKGVEFLPDAGPTDAAFVYRDGASFDGSDAEILQDVVDSRDSSLAEDVGDEVDGDGGEVDAQGDADVVEDVLHIEDADADEDVSDVKDVNQVDAYKRDCIERSSRYVYLVGSGSEFYNYDPVSGQFNQIGVLACPNAGDAKPFSMSVDRHGIAYILYGDGHLFRASTKTGACSGTNYVVNQQGFNLFGMGFSTELGGPQERLFVAGDVRLGGRSGLAWIDVRTMRLNVIADFTSSFYGAELTGTGDGKLYAFYQKLGLNGTYIGEVDKESARISNEHSLPGVNLGSAWAFAFFGGKFYTFTAARGVATSRVAELDPDTNNVRDVGVAPARVVGAGVSTCAPKE